MAEWIWQKVDVFLAALVVAGTGIAACQGHAYMAQYINHLGREVRIAGAHLTDVQSGLRYRVMGDTVRADLEAQAQTRFTKLKSGQDAMVGANVVTRPLMYAHYHDDTVAAETSRTFQPRLPFSAGSMAYTLAGMLLGFVLYEVLKLPVTIMLREPRKRRFRRRG